MKRELTPLQKLMRRADMLWNALFREDDFRFTGDIRVYVNGGMYVHPCGETYQEGGRDGFETKSGRIKCRCAFCAALKKAFRAAK
jgi:hypothetical protein